MTRRTPPTLATWMLLRLGTRQYAESLAGDLFEHYQNGRSRLWYWRQVMLALLLARTAVLRSAARRLVDAAVAVFALLALGAGTLAWANAVKHGPATPTQSCVSSVQATLIECAVTPRSR